MRTDRQADRLRETTNKNKKKKRVTSSTTRVHLVSVSFIHQSINQGDMIVTRDWCGFGVGFGLRTESRERKGGPVRLLSLPFFSTSSLCKWTLQEMLSQTRKGEKGDWKGWEKRPV